MTETLGEQFKNPKPVHASQLPWNTVRQAGAIHVGTEDQADAISSTKGWPIKAKRGGLRTGQGAIFEAGEHETHRLDWQPGVEFHPHVLSDSQANEAHYHHSLAHGYPRGLSIDHSLDDDPGQLREGSVVHQAVQALNEGKVVAYNNLHEGSGGTSHLVPDPHRMLRKRGEDPTPVHPTLFAAGQFAGNGPFRHAFSATPEDVRRVNVPGQIGQGASVKYEPHLAGAPHRPLTFDEKTQQSRSRTVESMKPKPKEQLISPDWGRAQGRLF